MPVFGPPHRPAGPRGTSGRDDCGRSRTRQRHNSDREEPYAVGGDRGHPPPPGVPILTRRGRRSDVRPHSPRLRGVVSSCMPRVGQGPLQGPGGCMNQHIADRVRFLRAFAANPRQVGAILPTSRYAVRDMLDLGDVPGAGLVVELGRGHRRADRRDPGPDAAGRPPGGAGDRPGAGRGCSRSVSTTPGCRSSATRPSTWRSTWTASSPTSWSARCRSRRWSRDCGGASWTRCRERWRRRGTALVIQYSPLIQSRSCAGSSRRSAGGSRC